jgi:hypothetical protein
VKLVSAIILLLAASSLPTYAQRRRGAPPNVALARVGTVVRDGSGSTVKVGSHLGIVPFYLLGDFDGDGSADRAALVNIGEARADLRSYGVRYINIDPYSRRKGSHIDPLVHASHNCPGIAIIHGTAAGWGVTKPAGKFMVYECFSSLRLTRRGQRIRRGGGSSGRTPVPEGDSILLDLETGGTALVYRNGKTYRGFGIRGGD